MAITDGTILKVVVSLLWTDGNLIQNIYNAVVTGVGAPWDPDDIVEDAISWAEDMYFNLTSNVSDEVDGSQVQVYEYDSVDDDWDEVGSGPFTWDPSSNSSQVARGVAALVNLKTTDPDVSGKKYVGGLTDGDFLDGLTTVAFAAVLASYAVDWYAGFAGTDSAADWAPGIWSPTRTAFYLAQPQVIIPTIPAYQRRRKRGVGV